MGIVKAFSPGNITCIFAIIPNKDPLKKGSLGVSFAVNKGAIAEVSKSTKNEMIVNGTRKKFPTVETAVRFLTNEKLKIKIKTQLPIGCGYGMSGACTLATVYAVNELLGLKKTKEELALTAHKAEVINNTGLGTVTAEFLGGILIRHKKGKPLSAKKLQIDRKAIYYKSFGPLDTKKIITSEKMRTRINEYGLGLLKKIKRKVALKELIALSKEFADNTGLLQDNRIKKVIREIENKGGKASMNMLGKSVFSDIAFKGCKKVLITDRGAYLL